MRALRVISVALLTAIVGGVLAVVTSLYLTKLYQVSDFEGGRGMLIFFALAPLGLIIGFIIGLVVALVIRAAGFPGFVKAQELQLGLLFHSRQLFRAYSTLQPTIHPNLMVNRSCSNSNLKFHRR